MSIEILIITPRTQSKGVPLTVKLNNTIAEAKKAYFDKVGNNINNQWIHDATVLNNDKKISDYPIDPLDTIEAHPSSDGGSYYS